MSQVNPLALNLVAIFALTGALIDNFSWGVCLALVASWLLIAMSVAAAVRYRKAVAAAESQVPADADDYGV